MIAEIILSILGFIDSILGLYTFIIVIWTVVSLLNNFDLLPRHDVIRRIGNLLHTLASPPIYFVQRYVPPMGNLDLSPLIVIFAIYISRIFLRQLEFFVAVNF